MVTWKVVFVAGCAVILRRSELAYLYVLIDVEIVHNLMISIDIEIKNKTLN